MSEKAKGFKVIYIYDIKTLQTMYRFTCNDCINRPYCRKHIDGVLRCPVENEIDMSKDIKSVNKAITYFGNQYFVLKQRKCKKAIEDIIQRYTR